jgi:ABC-type transporter MlaC component
MKILAIFTLFITLSANASMGPKDIVKYIFKTASLKSIGADEKLQNSINVNVDFNAMAVKALGSEFKKISKTEFTWFSKTIREIITKTVYPEAYGFLNKVRISYEEEEIESKTAEILSVVKNKAEETDVVYFFNKTKNVWKITDISIDDESWVESINEQVVRTIKKQKWSGLKSKLTKRLNKLNEKTK